MSLQSKLIFNHHLQVEMQTDTMFPPLQNKDTHTQRKQNRSAWIVVCQESNNNDTQMRWGFSETLLLLFLGVWNGNLCEKGDGKLCCFLHVCDVWWVFWQSGLFNNHLEHPVNKSIYWKRVNRQTEKSATALWKVFISCTGLDYFEDY